MACEGRPVLALTTSTRRGGVALAHGGELLFARSTQVGASHSTSLTRTVEEALGHAGLGLADLGAIVCDVGPGSFTGVRIGLSTARAWGWALGIPVVGAESLETLATAAARGLAEEGVVATAIGCRRGEVYLRVDRVSGGRIDATPFEARVLEDAAIEDLLAELARAAPALVLCGEGFGPLRSAADGLASRLPCTRVTRTSEAGDLPDPATLLGVGLSHPREAVPLYLAPSEAERKADLAARVSL